MFYSLKARCLASVFSILFLAFLPINSHGQSTLGTAIQGYLYGLPMVLMGETLEGFTGEERVCSLGTDINTFVNILDRPDTEFKAVVRPNVDTLYTSAMLDLTQGPQLMDMPAVSDRYVLMALMDAWSNNFAGVGTQTHGDQPGRYIIIGPQWEGDIPEGYEPIYSPTNLVWIIGRTEVRGYDDIATVNSIQRQYQLQPYGYELPDSGIDGCVPDSEKTPPIEVVLSLSGKEYFTRLSDLMARFPAPARDENMIKRLARIGVGPLAEIKVDDLSAKQLRALERGVRIGRSSINLFKSALGATGWGPNPAIIPLGDYGKRYFIRALVAEIGFGANRGEFAVYQNANRDSKFKLLDGESDYVITFKANRMPPVNGFWSFTVYGEDGFLTSNAAAEQLGLERYAIGSYDQLEYEENGDLKLYLSTTPPEGVPLSNWLPTPQGKFQVTARYYDPDEPILKSRWKTPVIVKQ